MKLMILGKNKITGLTKSRETFTELKEKHLEEANELKEALEEGIYRNIAEEAMDQIQVCIGILDKLASLGLNIDQITKRHNKKLVIRGWEEKGVIYIKCKKNV